MHKNISRLQVITQDVNEKTHIETAMEACEGGASWIQLRMKGVETPLLKESALQVQKICATNKATFILNDDVQLAIEINAHGVHLGKDDMEITAARKLTGDKMIIGFTTNTFNDIQKGTNAGADYLGLGPFRFTNTKKNLSPIIGLHGFEKIMNQYHKANFKIPIIAIGGIMPDDVEQLLQLGIYGVAVSTAINLSKNKFETINRFNTLLNKSPVTPINHAGASNSK